MRSGLEVVRCLGTGSSGQAWLARADGCHVVVKQVPLAGLSEAQRSQAMGEADVLRSCCHLNITQCLGCWVEDDCLNITMEYCSQGELGALIAARAAARQPLAEDAVMLCFVQILLALNHAHGRKIMHRDVKPANVFIAEGNLLKLGDFGIARQLAGAGDMASTLVGTPFYLAPEQIEGEPYSTQSDVWAAGCLLYELAALRRPFEGCGLAGLAVAILGGRPPPLPAARYSAGLRALVAALLQQQPQDRPTTADLLRMPYVRGHLARYAAHVCSIQAGMRARAPPGRVGERQECDAAGPGGGACEGGPGGAAPAAGLAPGAAGEGSSCGQQGSPRSHRLLATGWLTKQQAALEGLKQAFAAQGPTPGGAPCGSSAPAPASRCDPGESGAASTAGSPAARAAPVQAAPAGVAARPGAAARPLAHKHAAGARAAAAEAATAGGQVAAVRQARLQQRQQWEQQQQREAAAEQERRAARAAELSVASEERAAAREREKQEAQQALARYRSGLKGARPRLDRAALAQLGQGFAARQQLGEAAAAPGQQLADVAPGAEAGAEECALADGCVPRGEPPDLVSAVPPGQPAAGAGPKGGAGAAKRTPGGVAAVEASSSGRPAGPPLLQQQQQQQQRQPLVPPWRRPHPQPPGASTGPTIQLFCPFGAEDCEGDEDAQAAAHQQQHIPRPQQSEGSGGDDRAASSSGHSSSGPSQGVDAVLSQLQDALAAPDNGAAGGEQEGTSRRAASHADGARSGSAQPLPPQLRAQLEAELGAQQLPAACDAMRRLLLRQEAAAAGSPDEQGGAAGGGAGAAPSPQDELADMLAGSQVEPLYLLHLLRQLVLSQGAA